MSIENIPITGFADATALFTQIDTLIEQPGQAFVAYLNVHVANYAFNHPELKAILQSADMVYPDGAGIVLASQWLGQPLPCRLEAAGWIFEFVAFFAARQKTIFFLAGKPGVAEKAVRVLAQKIPHHTIVGIHHGFIADNPVLQSQAIEQINRLQPDLLVVGFGTPLQEVWIDQYRSQLDVKLIWPMGAVLDYVAGEIPRCPKWMGNMGLEWLYRFCYEPRRMFGRYVIGNPWFISRIAWQVVKKRLLF